MVISRRGRRKMEMNASLQVKQFVARVKSSTTGQRFNVFKTKDPKFYLFDPIDRNGCSTCCQFPVLIKDLRSDIKSALRHGWGNSE